MAPPAWLLKVDKKPFGPQMAGWFLASFAFAGTAIYLGYLNGEKLITMTPEWKKANEDYMRFQNMNPIFGISSKPKH